MSNQNLQKFETDLRAIIGQNDTLRPFVCEGSPLDCEVFIVGFNPATELSQPFWKFWRTEYGFDKTAWFESYKLDRQTKPLSHGKTRRANVSNTRRVIDWITEEARPTKCLETNLYALPTEQAKDLSTKNRVSGIFDFLLQTVRPKMVILHGKDAAQYLSKLPTSTKGIAVPHFSRGWSERNAKELGRHIHASCISGDIADFSNFVAEIGTSKPTYYGYKDEDFTDDFWKIIEEAKQLWEQKIEEFVATHPGGGSFFVIGAGIYVPVISPGKRKPKGKRVIPPPFSNDASIWSESGPEIVRFLQSKGISCWFDEGIDD